MRKFKKNFSPASAQPSVRDCIFDITSQIAQSCWADPNQRAAATTIALALLVCPQLVQVKYDAVFREFEATYLDVNVSVPKTFEQVSTRSHTGKGRFVFNILRAWKNEAGEYQWALLPDLAESYQDHIRNMKARKFLIENFPKSTSTRDRAAILGLAWAILQRLDVHEGLRVQGHAHNGWFWGSKELKVSVTISLNKVVWSEFPGL